jgi:hypothetical protein
VPQKVRQQIGTMKYLLTVMWGVDGFHVVDLMMIHKNLIPRTSWQTFWPHAFRECFWHGG